MGPWTSVLIIEVSLLVRCPDFKGTVCTLIQMGPWTSILIITVTLLERCPDFKGSKCVCTKMDRFPDFIKVSSIQESKRVYINTNGTMNK